MKTTPGNTRSTPGTELRKIKQTRPKNTGNTGA